MCRAVYGLCSPILLFILNLQMPALVANQDHVSAYLQKWSILALCFSDVAILHTILFVEMRSVYVLFTYTINFFALVYSIAVIATETILAGNFTIRSIYLLASTNLIAVIHLMMFLLMAIVNNRLSSPFLKKTVLVYLGLFFLAVPTSFLAISINSSAKEIKPWVYFAYVSVMFYLTMMGILIKHGPKASSSGNSSFKYSMAVIITNLLFFPGVAAFCVYEGLSKANNYQTPVDTNFNLIFLGLVITPAAFLTSIVSSFACCASLLISSQIDSDSDIEDLAMQDASSLTSEPMELKKSLLEIDFESRKETDCAICWEEFQTADKLIAVKGCNHTFHADCLATWTAKKANCPLCKAGIKQFSQEAALKLILEP